MFGLDKLIKEINQGAHATLCTAWGGHDFIRLGQKTLVCKHCGLKRVGE